MALQSSTLGNIFSLVLESDPKGTFSTTLKPTMVHESQVRLQFFHLKKQTFCCFLLRWQARLTHKVTFREMFSRIFLLWGNQNYCDWQTPKMNNQTVFLFTVLGTVLSVLQLISSSFVIFYWFLHFTFNKYCSVLLPSLQASIPWAASSTQSHLQRTVQKRPILKLPYFRYRTAAVKGKIRLLFFRLAWDD